jgi:hypothetical protein
MDRNQGLVDEVERKEFHTITVSVNAAGIHISKSGAVLQHIFERLSYIPLRSQSLHRVKRFFHDLTPQWFKGEA